MSRHYDFAGWVTKNDIRCSDGVTIRHNAFKDCDGKKVPLIWNHDRKDPSNVLGHMILHAQDEGVYGFGYFNSNEKAQSAKVMVENGDISAMSIAANKIKKQGNNVVHGKIFEVSLVLSGANDGAVIDSVVTHSDEDDSDTMDIIFQTGLLIHSSEDEFYLVDEEDEDQDEPEIEHDEGEGKMAEKTVGDVLDTLDEEQMQAVEITIAEALRMAEEGDESVKHNVFEDQDTYYGGGYDSEIAHSEVNELIQDAFDNKVGSMRDFITANLSDDIQHDDTAPYGIKDIEVLFPEAMQLNKEPAIHKDNQTGAIEIVNGTHKSPFARIKTRYADLTAKECRARGYVKKNRKIEQVFEIFGRETNPQTIYKKQKLDRDDIVDIVDFDVVAYLWKEMKMMLLEEVGRAILVGDGRPVGDKDKIKEDKIRPIMTDDDLYTIKINFASAASFTEVFLRNIHRYRGTGGATLYMDFALLADIKLLKSSDGKFIFGDIPSTEAVASRLGVSRIRPTTLLKNRSACLVNLNDYHVGSSKGGEVTNFDDFDIDFNQYKYLTETRLSGALVLPESAMAFKMGGTDTNPDDFTIPATVPDKYKVDGAEGPSTDGKKEKAEAKSSDYDPFADNNQNGDDE